MQFLYAIEGVSAINAKCLAECGLDKIIREPSRVMQRGAAGPGEGGCLFSSGRDSKRLRYDKDAQRWAKSITDKYWIGYWLDGKPTAADLARDEQIDGHEVKLSDESKWKIPTARCFPIGTNLPETLILTTDGIGSKTIAKYADFSRRALAMWNSVLQQLKIFEGEPDEIIGPADEWKLAAEALGLNYYVGADEINALELLTTGNLAEVVLAVVDMPTYRQWLADEIAKKKDPATSKE